jgi:hypothetical protein
MDAPEEESGQFSKLREEVRQKLEVLRTKTAPILDELSRLEKLAASLDEFDQKPQRVSNTMIGFLAGMQMASRPKVLTSSNNTTIPHDDFTFPILESLYELGGAATRDAVLNRVENKLKDQLRPRDLERLKSCGDLRWRNRASYQRKNMIREGLLQEHSPYSVWEMTPQGREYLKENLILLKNIFGEDYAKLGHPDI